MVTDFSPPSFILSLLIRSSHCVWHCIPRHRHTHTRSHSHTDPSTFSVPADVSTQCVGLVRSCAVCWEDMNNWPKAEQKIEESCSIWIILAIQFILECQNCILMIHFDHLPVCLLTCCTPQFCFFQFLLPISVVVIAWAVMTCQGEY